VIGPAAWLVAGALAGWVGAVWLWGPEVRLAVGLGIGGPLVAALVTRLLVVRTIRRDPRRLTARLIGALAGKMVFFGVFVAVAVRGFEVRPIAFAVSFTVAFIALQGAEAMLLRRALNPVPPGP
jgi:hypothetical protein